jgi:hypothetical protein
MRPVMALAMILFGLKAAMADAACDLHAAARACLVKASLESGASDDSAFALSAPAQPADAPHNQAEQSAEPPQPPAPASTKMDAKGQKAFSIAELCNALYSSAKDNSLPVPFFANLIWQESRLQLDAVSRVGALGIAQFMPKVAAEAGLKDPFDPAQAIPASAKFLHVLRAQFGNLGYVAAAYNAGSHRVLDWLERGRVLPRETQVYVVRVTGRSAESWRKSPLSDWQMAFARELPCRQVPAFADLEEAQARMRAARQVAQAQLPPPPEKDAIKTSPTGTPRLANNAESRRGLKPAANDERRADKKRPGGLRTVLAMVERKEQRKETRSVAADKAAHVHAVRHEPTRHPHAGHERRRVA